MRRRTMLLMALAVAAFGCGDGNGGGDDADAADIREDLDAVDEVSPDGDVPAEDLTTEDPAAEDAGGEDAGGEDAGEDPMDVPSEEAPDAVPDHQEDFDPEQACLASGGTVDTMDCCTTVDDFPNLCLEGPCGCAPEYSHEISVCACGTGECFNGTACVPL